MKIEKNDVVILLNEFVKNMWFTDNPITAYERACGLLCGFEKNKHYTEEKQREDLTFIVSKMDDFQDFKVENIFKIIYEHQSELHVVEIMKNM